MTGDIIPLERTVPPVNAEPIAGGGPEGTVNVTSIIPHDDYIIGVSVGSKKLHLSGVN